VTPQRADADRVRRHRDAERLGDPRNVQVALGLAVVEDPAAAEQQEVKAVDLLDELVEAGLPRVEHPVDGMVLARVAHVACEDRQLHAGQLAAQLLEGDGEDRLVAEAQAAVGTGWRWIEHNVAVEVKNPLHARTDFAPFESWEDRGLLDAYDAAHGVAGHAVGTMTAPDGPAEESAA
jgi:hypothetical protein